MISIGFQERAIGASPLSLRLQALNPEEGIIKLS
jgi:hypothetical protein